MRFKAQSLKVSYLSGSTVSLKSSDVLNFMTIKQETKNKRFEINDSKRRSSLFNTLKPETQLRDI
jgi:hypothetical protein